MVYFRALRGSAACISRLSIGLRIRTEGINFIVTPAQTTRAFNTPTKAGAASPYYRGLAAEDART